MQQKTKIRVLFFHSLISITGKDSLEIVCPEPQPTLSLLLNRIIEIFPAITAQRNSLMLAVNEEYASANRILKDGDTVALLPPVSGG